jgi:ribosome recycling factor
MTYNFSVLKNSLKESEEWLKKELSGIRTGRATPAILDVVKVEAYGSMMPINQLANVSVEDARTLRISPWDISVSKSIEKAIMLSSLGLSVTVDDKGLRAIFPNLTEERRQALVKIAKQKLEEAKVAVRSEREKVHKDIEKQKKEKQISEDEEFKIKQDIQKLLETTNKALDEIFEKKEKEILE